MWSKSDLHFAIFLGSFWYWVLAFEFDVCGICCKLSVLTLWFRTCRSQLKLSLRYKEKDCSTLGVLAVVFT